MGNYIFLILVLASFFGLSKLFVKAGVEGWKGWIPFYNFYILSRLLKKPWWWCLIMVVPGVNILMYGVYGFNVARAFNKPATSDLLFASLLPYIYFVKLGFDNTAKFAGLDKFKKEPSKFVKNWLDPIIFAVIAASIIRGYTIEAFTIPTSSLEKSLMVGDFLFVNKFAYGPKIPQTPLSFPFAHHTLPLSETKKSYLEWIKLPYMRLPGFGKVNNQEIVVFNYPDGDTVALKQQNQSYYQIIRDQMESDMKKNKNISRESAYSKAWLAVNTDEGYYGKITARPPDKREHYVKRCTGIAGDKFEVRDGNVFINDQMQAMPPKAQHHYFVKAKSDFLSKRYLDNLDIYFSEAYKISIALNEEFKTPTVAASLIGMDNGRYMAIEDLKVSDFEATLKTNDTIIYSINMPPATAEIVKNDPAVYSVKKRVDKKGEYNSRIFPHNPTYPWNNDNFGPMQIPKEGMTLPIDTHNICLYEKILSTYDDGIHQITKQGAQVLYDGKAITNYTFKQNYYFMMGDNRHNSADSRSWGFVPFDHVVGSPFFVWFSMKYPENNPISGTNILGSFFKNSKEGKFRWERFLCYVEDGNLHSIKIPFILSILAIWGFSKWNTRRKLKAAKT